MPHDVADHEGVIAEDLEQLLTPLRKAGLVRSYLNPRSQMQLAALR